MPSAADNKPILTAPERSLAFGVCAIALITAASIGAQHFVTEAYVRGVEKGRAEVTSFVQDCENRGGTVDMNASGSIRICGNVRGVNALIANATP